MPRKTKETSTSNSNKKEEKKLTDKIIDTVSNLKSKLEKKASSKTDEVTKTTKSKAKAVKKDESKPSKSKSKVVKEENKKTTKSKSKAGKKDEDKPSKAKSKVVKEEAKETAKSKAKAVKKDESKPSKAKSKVVKEKTKETAKSKAKAIKKDESKPSKAKSKVVKEENKKTTKNKVEEVKKEKSKTSKTKSKAVKEATQPDKTTKKSSKSSKSKSTTPVVSFTPEYYDLPYRYNKTVVKILAQTPNNLFIYWEISDKDRENFKKQYGEYLFEITKPILIIHNLTKDYTFELDINDFANSWYLEVNDSDCQYKIELGRRPIPVNYNYIPQYDINKNGPISPIETPYIYISSSNELETPNDHILFNKQNKIYFRNIKTNEIIEKDILDFPNIYQNNHFVNIYELYKDLYKDELLNDVLDLRNPSSGNPSSSSLSSKFI